MLLPRTALTYDAPIIFDSSFDLLQAGARHSFLVLYVV